MIGISPIISGKRELVRTKKILIADDVVAALRAPSQVRVAAQIAIGINRLEFDTGILRPFIIESVEY